MDSSIQIWIFLDSQSERFFGKGFEKSIFGKQFVEKKNSTQQMVYMYDILRPCLQGGRVTLVPGLP